MREKNREKTERTEEQREQNREKADWTEEQREQNREKTERMEEQEQDKTEQAGWERAEEKQNAAGKRRFKLTGCFAAKAMAVVLLFISVAACTAGASAVYIAAEENMYSSSFSTVLQSTLSGQAHSIAYAVRDAVNNGEAGLLPEYLEEKNAEAAILKPEDMLVSGSSAFIWKSYEDAEALKENGFYSSLYEDIEMSFFPSVVSSGELMDAGGSEETMERYIVRVFFDPRFDKQDDIRVIFRLTEFLYRFRYAAIWVCAGSAVLLAVCIIFLLCSAGHKNGREGIVPGLLTGIPFDVMTLGMVLVSYWIWWLAAEWLNYISYSLAVAVTCLVLLVLGLIYLWDLAIRLKLGKLWRHTLTFLMLRLLKRGLQAVWRLVLGIPLIWTTVAAYLAVCLLEFLGMVRFTRVRSGGWFAWWMEKTVLFVVVLYIALTCRKLLKASRELAAGHEDYRVDTGRMVGAFLEHGENLNSIGQGVSRAVAEKTKSERLKTELISNVSHDLKTPLTSIINYAELIGREETENATIKEYAEVLLRQSGRLKRLLENLVEASKAVTGSLEVNLEPCEAGVLLSQAAGEYQQRMEEKGLELRVNQPEEPVRILADGRHLWRVFDNLLNNICKYAQESSRVYLTLEQKEEKVFIIFRNMSKYALDISPEELEERFVRGDKSRNMEGNGLGLSIAKSLTELQQGQMDIVIDGDLFKVTLTFDAL